MNEKLTCEERIDAQMESTIEEVTRRLKLYKGELKKPVEDQYRLIVDCDERGEVAVSVYAIDEEGEDEKEPIWRLPKMSWDEAENYDGSDLFDPTDTYDVLQYLIGNNFVEKNSTLLEAGDEVEMEAVDEEQEGSLSEYGLCFDYVAPGTFEDQEDGYFRWQLSWGGPSDEFRFYASQTRNGWEAFKVEYWFMDWYDGARRTLYSDDKATLLEVFQMFDDLGATEVEYERSLEE